MTGYHSEFLLTFNTNITMYRVMQTIITKSIKENQENQPIIFIEPYREALEEIEDQIPNTLDRFLEFQARNLVQFYYSEFENYIYKCIRAILISSPGKMTKNQITIGIIIKYNYDVKRVIEFKAEKVVEKLLKKPFKAIFEEIDEEYDIKLIITEEELKELKRFKQIRNLFAHRSGKIDKTFINNFREEKLKEGDILKLKLSEIDKYALIITNLLFKFDQALSITYPKLVSYVP